MDYTISIIPTDPAGGSTVRNLPHTQQDWHPSDDGASQIFNTPIETGALLDAKQGKDPDYRGTCGIVSCVNVLRLAGRLNTTEEEALQCAIDNFLCEVEIDSPDYRGGTGAEERRKLLKLFGVESDLVDSSIEAIAEHVSAGKGVIISVEVGELWRRPYCRGYHAVTVTSVQKNQNGEIEGFYICDSGSGRNDRARFYRADHLEQALTTRKMNVTTSIIR